MYYLKLILDYLDCKKYRKLYLEEKDKNEELQDKIDDIIKTLIHLN
jgi:hypothetical protein